MTSVNSSMFTGLMSTISVEERERKKERKREREERETEAEIRCYDFKV